MQMVNKHMKRCSKLLITREISNQNCKDLSPHTKQNGHHQKNLQKINSGEEVEKREFSCIVGESHSVMPNSLQPHGLYSPWNSPNQNIGLGSLSLLWGIFPTQGSNPGLPYCRWILYQLSYKGSALLVGT